MCCICNIWDFRSFILPGPPLSSNKHSQYVAERVSGRNNILKALAGTSWGQQKETLLMTHKAVGRSIINYAAPVWSPNLHDTNYRKIQYTQNEALRIATGCHKMSSIDHLHTEAEILKVKEHSELLSAQYLARCLEPGNVCHPITSRVIPERQMKETLYTRHQKHCRANDQGTKRITGQYSLLRTSAPQEILVRTGQHWSVYTREASEIFKLSGC